MFICMTDLCVSKQGEKTILYYFHKIIKWTNAKVSEDARVKFSFVIKGQNQCPWWHIVYNVNLFKETFFILF